MCGIAGSVHWRGAPPTQEEIVRMCDSIMHRGPNDAGYLVEGPLAMGMRRLSIIDLAGGHQPIWNEDKTVGVVFNGEIYNYRELRAELEAKGHRFSTSSDTETLVHLWEEEGIEFPRRLNGMFAFALYDRKQQKFVLGRDHVGIKPLYYALDANGIVFGSEVKALLASGRLKPRLNVDAVAQFLSWEYVPGAGTMMQGIQRLEPARTLEIELRTGKSSVRRFWSPLNATGQTNAKRSDAEWEEEAEQVIHRAVQSQLVAEVPLGAFLSGGVDSSLVVAAMGNAETFSIGFDDPSYNETQWSKRVADHLGVNHHVEIIQPQVRELFDHLMHFMDDPIGDFSIFPTYLVSRLAGKQVTVVLSGDGGDEVFGGYETFLAHEKARTYQRIPGWLRRGVMEPVIGALPPQSKKKGLINKAKRFVEGARLDSGWGHARWRVFCDEVVRNRLFTTGARKAIATPVGAHILALQAEARDRDERDRTLYVDFGSYLVDNCLTKVDRMSMAVSIEARVPLLDKDVVEFAFRMPSRLKFDGSQTKILLKRVAARHVPRECVYRPKEGFSIPIKTWLKNEFRPLVERYLAPERLKQEGLFDPQVVQQLWNEHVNDRANHSHLLWSLLVFEQWRDRWGVAA